MYTITIKIADHFGKMITSDRQVYDWLKQHFQYERGISEQSPHFTLEISRGYGSAVSDYDVHISAAGERIRFERMDYLMETSRDYSEVTLSVYNLFALKHALMNLYSSFIIHHRWGLLIHSSCIIHHGEAHLFSGHSGAGKSTVALLSKPRMILSDEATLVCMKEQKPIVVDSPFRSDSRSDFHEQSYPLSGIYLLKQSDVHQLDPLKASHALLQMTHQVFYWAHDAGETSAVFNMLHHMLKHVPAYELYFQKNNQFWELIS